MEAEPIYNSSVFEIKSQRPKLLLDDVNTTNLDAISTSVMAVVLVPARRDSHAVSGVKGKSDPLMDPNPVFLALRRHA